MESQNPNVTPKAKVTAGPGSEKTMFILELLDYSLKKRLDEGTKGRIMGLIGREIEQAGVLGKEILERLDRLEGKGGVNNIKDGTEHREKTVLTEEKQSKRARSKLSSNNDSKSNETRMEKDLGASNPSATTLFLKEFKTDGSGLKEMVHVPSEELDLEILLEQIKEHPIFSSAFGKKDKPGFKGVHKMAYWSARNLVKDFELLGVPYWTSFGTHPYGENGDSNYSQKVNDFKRSYRFGPSEEGYTNLLLKIEELVEKGVTRFKPKVVFEPDRRVFGLRANLYTWVPSIINGLKYIISNINQHSNFEGSRDFEQKQIVIRAERIPVRNSIEISICDFNSWGNRPNYILLEEFRNSEAYRYFHSLCDWTVLFSDGEEHFQLNVLHRIENLTNPSIVPLSASPLGFTHVLTFYES